MAWRRRTLAPYDKSLLAQAPVLEHGVPTNYDVGLLNAGARLDAQAQAQAQAQSLPKISNNDSAMEANKMGAPMPQDPVVPFWSRKAGKITLCVIVGLIIIIAVSLGAGLGIRKNSPHSSRATAGPATADPGASQTSAKTTSKPASSTLSSSTGSSRLPVSTVSSSPASTSSASTTLPTIIID